MKHIKVFEKLSDTQTFDSVSNEMKACAAERARAEQEYLAALKAQLTVLDQALNTDLFARDFKKIATDQRTNVRKIIECITGNPA